MKEVENDFIKFWIEGGILYSQFKKPTIVNIENIKILIDLRTEISDGEKQYWCYDFKGIESYDKEARDYAEIYGQEYLYACAAVFNSHIAKFTLNTFMILKKPVIPLKGFVQKSDAVNWLNEIKKKKEQL
ncbi:hypothetical protein AAGV33_00850 [Flavobacterium sp. FBOR7N2.3]|uniref:DUF7793 domain-containing protein n=1 Tax=Flavobacterium magnesitis TaxID=3138077 RepID=A0ABV4THP9_9FLAO